MAAIVFVFVAMSVLRAIWEPEPAAPAKTKVRRLGFHQKVEMELSQNARDRSPRRRCGVKAMLKTWAKGETSTVGMWRLCHAIVAGDGTDAGVGMSRLASLGSERGGSEQNCVRGIRDLLAATSLPEMIHKVHHGLGDGTVTHTLPPTDLIRLIHSHNRTKFGQIFTADPVFLKKFWRSLFDSEHGR